MAAWSSATIVLGGKTMGQVTLVGRISIPGTAVDRSGLEGLLETGTPQNALGGFSAIEYSGSKDRYFVLSDRGAGDGAASFACRFHDMEFSIGRSPQEATWNLLDTKLLCSPEGDRFTGSLEPVKKWNGSGLPPSLDPEGIRFGRDGTLIISDEYGPSILRFDRDGKLDRAFSIPSSFLLSEKLTPPMVRGTYPNRGMEGLALTPDGKWLVGAMQGPLVQDGRIEKNKCLGLVTRWLAIELQSGRSLEWMYPLEDESTGVSEVLAIDSQRFLVLERDSKEGAKAKIKRIFLADATSATDVSRIPSLREGLPVGHRGLEKRPFIDLMNSSYGLSGDSTPEKPEGLTWGPPTDDGHRLLLVCFDNDFEPHRDSFVLAFRIEGL
jgi:hypothetical protein